MLPSMKSTINPETLRTGLFGDLSEWSTHVGRAADQLLFPKAPQIPDARDSSHLDSLKFETAQMRGKFDSSVDALLSALDPYGTFDFSSGFEAAHREELTKWEPLTIPLLKRALTREHGREIAIFAVGALG